MIKGNNMSQNHLNSEAQKANRYQNIHKNYVLPHDKFYGESSYQNSYPKNYVDYNDLRAHISKPKSTIQPHIFQGQSSYNNSYKDNQNPYIKTEKFRQADNLKVSDQPFVATSQYNDRLKGQISNSRAQRKIHPQNQIFPVGVFQGGSNYTNSYTTNQIKRDPQFRPQGQLKIGQSKFEGHSSYLDDYSRVNGQVKPQKFIQKNNEVMPKGQFNGQSTYHNAYLGSKAELNKKFVPQSQLKVGGRFQGQSSYLNDYNSKQIFKAQKYQLPQNETIPKGRFQGQSSYNNSYTGDKAQKAQQFKPLQQWKVQGNFQGNSSYQNDFKKPLNQIKRPLISMPNNQFMPKGKFQQNSNYQSNYVQYGQTRQRQYKPQGQLKIGDGYFQGNSSYVADFQTRGPQQMRPNFKPQQNQVIPKGQFKGQSIYHQNYIPSIIQKGQSYRPKPQLQVGGRFEGVSSYTGQFNQKKGIKAQRVPLPINQVMPQGKFNGQSLYTNSYVPSAIQKRQKITMQSQLKVGEGHFEGNSNYAQNYQYSPVKKQKYQVQVNTGPKWNKKASRWQ